MTLSILCLAAALAGAPAIDIHEASVSETQRAFARGDLTSEQLVRAQLDRIAGMDRKGPSLHSFISINPNALAEARRADAARRGAAEETPLLGVTVSIKDLIDVKGMATTAGALALADNVAEDDAYAVAKLRRAGAVILGKANTSQWANARSPQTISGWSATGGLARNPYALDRDTSGSSSGSAVSVSAGLAAFSLGTDTTGSVTGPASTNGVVGLRPTAGLVSRSGVIPFNERMDTIGPIARYVSDAATVLSVIAGTDTEDPYTAEADDRKEDYVAALDANALSGARIGVLRYASVGHPLTEETFNSALDTLRSKGAVLVEIASSPRPAEAAHRPSGDGLAHARYDRLLAAMPDSVKVRSLKQLVEFNREHAAAELSLFGQEILESALRAAPVEPSDETNRAADERMAQARADMDRLFAENDVEILVAPTALPAARIDAVVRSNSSFLGGVSSLAARAGYPHLTVPMGNVRGLPVGLSFLGPQWSDARVLSFGYAFEQASQARRPPSFLPSIEGTPAIAAAMQPAGIMADRPD